MFAFVFEGALFEFTMNEPALAPLFAFAERSKPLVFVQPFFIILSFFDRPRFAYRFEKQRREPKFAGECEGA